MNIVERVKRICLSPDSEWPVIAGEHATLSTLITGYALPLAALSAIAGFIGTSMLIGVAFAGPVAVVSLVMSLLGVVVLSVVIDALAPSFGSTRNSESSAKVAAYAPTPVWVGGLFQIIPFLGTLVALLGGLYALYQLYLGLLHVKKSPQDKAVIYTVVVVLIALVVGYVASFITSMLIVAPTMRNIF